MTGFVCDVGSSVDVGKTTRVDVERTRVDVAVGVVVFVVGMTVPALLVGCAVGCVVLVPAAVLVLGTVLRVVIEMTSFVVKNFVVSDVVGASVAACVALMKATQRNHASMQRVEDSTPVTRGDIREAINRKRECFGSQIAEKIVEMTSAFF